MRAKSSNPKAPAERVVKDIRRTTRNTSQGAVSLIATRLRLAELLL